MILKRIPYPEHPNRCQAVGKTGQCPYLASTNDSGEYVSKYCQRHGGNSAAQTANRESQRLYLSALWQDRIGRNAEHPKIISLRDEVGILRMTLDMKLESLKDEQELLMNAHQVVTLVREIRDTVREAGKVELILGKMLSKSEAEKLIQKILDIIMNYIKDAETIKMISEDMLAELEAITQPRTD